VATSTIADDAVTSAKIADLTIVTGNISNGGVTNPNLGGGAVDSRVLADNSVLSRHIANGEVKNEDLGGGITNDKLAGGITNDKLAGSITNDKLAGGITNDKLAGGITLDKLAGNSVDSSKIVNGSVQNEDLAEDSVGTGKIRDTNVTARKLADNAAVNRVIDNGAVTATKLGQGAVTTDKIDTQAVTNVKIREGTISKNRLAFTPVTNVRAGSGLSGGGAADEVTLSVNFTAVARADHPHNGFASSTHTHNVTGNTNSGGAAPNQFHTHFFGSGTTGPQSSLRYKKDISHYDFDVSKLLETNLVRFRYLNQFGYKATNRDWFYGYIAEELEDLGFEEILHYDEKLTPNAVDYSLVGVLTLELVKLQQKRIEELETIVEKMMKKEL
jgi:hypothetical protein